jgi:hypothetical protein
MNGLLRRGLLTAALVLMAAAAQASAQDAPAATPSRGGWLGAGLGYGAFRTDCSNCARDDLYSSGGSLVVNGGVTVNDRVDAGGEIHWASTALDSGEYRAAFLLGIVQFRPWRTRGFYLKGGLGLAFLHSRITVNGETTSSAPKGLGVHYGAGWIVRQGRRVSFAPFGGQYVATLGDIALPSSVAENVVGNSWLAGVVVLFR